MPEVARKAARLVEPSNINALSAKLRRAALLRWKRRDSVTVSMVNPGPFPEAHIFDLSSLESGRAEVSQPPAIAKAGTGGRAFALVVLLFSGRAFSLPTAPETGACSLENAVPATIAAVDEDFDLLLDDGRRAVLSGLEFPPPAKSGPDMRAKARQRLSDWLSGRDVFLGALAAGLDRWGRAPVRLFAASGQGADAPLVSVGAAMLEAGDARFRPDPTAADCAKTYLAAEAAARAAGRGIWAEASLRPIDPAAPQARATLLHRKGMAIVEGVIRSIGESHSSIYLNFSEKRIEGFSVVILRRNLAMFAKAGIDPHTLIGRRTRVRGLIETGFGPRMEIATPAEIELIDAVDAR